MPLIEKNMLSLQSELIKVLTHIYCKMKKIIISLVAFVAMSALMVSCHNNSMFKLSVEAIDGKGTASVMWPADATVATWDDAMNPVEVTLSGIAPDKSYASIVMPEGTTTKGVRRFVYPASVCAGEGKVMIAPVQSGMDCPATMPCYAEAAEGKAELVFKSLCGVVQLNLTTAEKLASVQISTEDSTNYLAGRFGVDNYPFPVLKAEADASKCVRCEKLAAFDFSKGSELYLYVAPGCYDTFTVTLTTEDGRTCVKNLKDDKYIVVDRNVICTINLGQNEGDLVFE